LRPVETIRTEDARRAHLIPFSWWIFVVDPWGTYVWGEQAYLAHPMPLGFPKMRGRCYSRRRFHLIKCACSAQFRQWPTLDVELRISFLESHFHIRHSIFIHHEVIQTNLCFATNTGDRLQ
jgi:hypothetical protein